MPGLPRVVTFDFWNTLYRHTGTSAYRRKIRENVLRLAAESIGLADAAQVSRDLFDTVDTEIKRRWRLSATATSETDLLALTTAAFAGRVPSHHVTMLLGVLYNVYTEDLKPDICPGASQFLTWAHRFASLYIISDTYTLRGHVIDRILERDGLLKVFQDRYYSDRTGVQKPNSPAIAEILERERVDAREVVHVGDLLDRDWEMSRLFGCKFILLALEPASDIELPKDDLFLGVARSFGEVRAIMESMQ